MTEAFIVGLALWVWVVVAIIMYACWASNERAISQGTTIKDKGWLKLDGKIYRLRQV